MRIIFLNIYILVYFLSIQSALKANDLLQNVYGRKITTLNGKWNFIIDPYENGYYDYRYMPFDQNRDPQNERNAFFNDTKPQDYTDRVEYSFDKSPTLIVPRSWNRQDDKLFFYEGTIWYRRIFNYIKENQTNRVFIHFGAINYDADVYLNGHKLGKHIGGFTPFNFEITSHLNDTGNYLIVKVDNKRKREGVPTLNTDWHNYGGITRDVNLIEEPGVLIKDYLIQLMKGSLNKLSGYVAVDPKSECEVIVEIPELKLVKKLKTNSEGVSQIDFNIENIQFWTPENPKLYDVIIKLNKYSIHDQIGFRIIETKGSEILLNRKPVFLRGICMHEENPYFGDRAYSEADAKMLIKWLKELNCNFVRLTHYPHNEYIIKEAEKNGIMVWEEIPVYWTILWNDPNTLENAKNQLSDIISRDKNRANVIIWSMANETPPGPDRNNFLKNLALHTRQQDNTRLISAALEKHSNPESPLELMVEDDFAEYSDIVSFNQYIGWYDGFPDKCRKVKWNIKYDKPVLVSEFGGGALQGFHGDSLTRWSEEYQEYLYKETLPMLDKIPSLRGITPWLLVDFRSPRRQLPGIQDGWNRKGVIGETGVKKKAFYILKKYYDAKEIKYK